MRNALLLSTIGILLPIIILKPHVGIYAWSWLAYMNPHRLAYGAIQSAPFAMVVGIVTIFAFLISREPKRFPLTTITVTLLIFHAWITITTVFAIDPDAAVEDWIQASKILLMTYLTLPLINTRRRLEILALVIALSIGFFGIKGGAWVIVTGGEWALYGPSRSMIADNNALALALSMVLPLFGYFYMESKNTWVRLGIVFCIATCFLSIAGTYARGVYIGMAAVLGLLWLRSRHRLLIGLAGLLAVGAVFAIMPTQFNEEISSIEKYEEDSSSLQRLWVWRFGWNLAVDRPLTGGGFGVFPYEPIYPQYGLRICSFEEVQTGCVVKPRSAHSNLFQVLGEHGFVGLAIFGFLGLYSFFCGYTVIRMTNGRDDLRWAANMARMLQLSIVAYGVGGTLEIGVGSGERTWIATGSGAASATAPKKRAYSVSGRLGTGGGCRITQAAPRPAATRAISTWPAMVASAMVTASGTRPAMSSAAQSMTWRRSVVDSLPTSVARPRIAIPWAPPAMQVSTCRRMRSRSSRPSRSKKA